MMTSKSIRLTFFAPIIACAVLDGCVTGEQAASSTASPGATCGELTETRHKVARQLDAAEHDHAAPNSVAGLILLAGLLATPVGAPNMGVLATEDRRRALAQLQAERATLDREIDDKRCTAEARAKAGTIKVSDDMRNDGVYEGKGSTESWCASPALSLTIESGRLSGTLRGDETYRLRGQVYDSGDVSLFFKNSEAGDFTDDVDGHLTGNVLSFAARLDDGPKGCSYRFSVEGKPLRPAGHDRPDVKAAGRLFTGLWKARNVLEVDRSAGGCAKEGTAYSLDLTGDTLTVDDVNGRMLTTSVPSDGKIDQSFRSPSGARLEIVGNARSRDLEIVNSRYGCRWKLVPVQ
jgi:hypothetical protein